jgi:hypothetical protein
VKEDIVMLHKIVLPAAAAALAALLTPSPAGAYGAAHVGSTYIGSNGAYHTGTTAVSRPSWAYGGTVYNPSTRTRVYGDYDYHPNVYSDYDRYGGYGGYGWRYRYSPRYYGRYYGGYDYRNVYGWHRYGYFR